MSRDYMEIGGAPKSSMQGSVETLQYRVFSKFGPLLGPFDTMVITALRALGYKMESQFWKPADVPGIFS